MSLIFGYVSHEFQRLVFSPSNDSTEEIWPKQRQGGFLVKGFFLTHGRGELLKADSRSNHGLSGGESDVERER